MFDSDRGRVRRVQAGDALAAHSTLRRIHHVDAHVLRTSGTDTRTPEQWAREIMENVPLATRIALHKGWAMLGLKLDHDDPGTVAGWAVSEDNADFIRLEAVSRIGLVGQLVTRLTDDGVEFATFVELRNVAAKTLWAAVLPGHLATVRSLLDHAAARVHA